MKLEQKVGKEKLIELLSTMPVREINRQYGYSRNALMAARKEYGIFAHNQYEAHDALRYENIASNMIVPNTYDEFTTVNDEWSAYWLGFIFADGCVYESKRLGSETPYRGLRIGLAIKDKCHLEMFSKYSGMQVKELMVHNKQTGKSYPSCYVRRQSPKIAFNLMNLGVIPRKSYVDHYIPRISKSLFRHFVRGYFDGDGCVFVGDTLVVSLPLDGDLCLRAAVHAAGAGRAGAEADGGFQVVVVCDAWQLLQAHRRAAPGEEHGNAAEADE